MRRKQAFKKIKQYKLQIDSATEIDKNYSPDCTCENEITLRKQMTKKFEMR